MATLPLLTDALLTGRDDSLIDHASLERPVHRELVPAFLRLRERALAAGFDLAIASGYRNYARQLRIWNEKVSGQRPLLDSRGALLDASGLSDWERVEAILRWSALPGASRHHWGSDIDVYDRAAVPADYVVQLTPDEVADDGPFGPLHRWLDAQMAAGDCCGFFRPYAEDRGGVAPERWHLSYAPVALQFQRQLTPQRLLRALDSPELQLRGVVHCRWPEIFERFIWVSPACYPTVAGG
jgi:LAS superfamily LD-carboxypeptidase LdcB